MSYDALRESLRLLDGAPPSQSARLSRRVRFVPLAVDRDGEVAATMFLRRSVSGVPVLEVHTLERADGGWRLLGGGGGPGDEVTEPRRPLADLGTVAVSHGAGGTARTRSRPFPFGRDGWISWVELRLAEEVGALRVADRLLPVARHGSAVVVWTRRPPRVNALDASGTVLGWIPLARGV